MKGRHVAFASPRGRQTGVALVELALALPLLIMLSVLVAEVGRAFYQYNTLAKSLRDAVRFLSVQDPSIASTDPDRITQARHMVVYGVPSPAAGAQPLIPGLNLSHVPESAIRWSLTDTTPRYRVVSIRVTGYAFRPLVGQVFGLRLADDRGFISFGPVAAHMRAPQ